MQKNPCSPLALIQSGHLDKRWHGCNASASAGRQFLYVQTGAGGIVDGYRVNANGSLTPVGSPVTVLNAVGGRGDGLLTINDSELAATFAGVAASLRYVTHPSSWLPVRCLGHQRPESQAQRRSQEACDVPSHPALSWADKPWAR